MSKEGDFCRLMANKAFKFNSPRLEIAPIDSENISEDKWTKLFYVVNEMMKKVSQSLDLKFTIDISEGRDPYLECRMSVDGRHENITLKMTVMDDNVNVCIHCGSISKISKKTENELKAHFGKLQNPY